MADCTTHKDDVCPFALRCAIPFAALSKCYLKDTSKPFKWINNEPTSLYWMGELVQTQLDRSEAGRQVCSSYKMWLPVLFRSSDYGAEDLSTNLLPLGLRALSAALSPGHGDVLGDFQLSLTLS